MKPSKDRNRQSVQTRIVLILCVPLVAAAIYSRFRVEVRAAKEHGGIPLVNRFRTVKVGGVHRPASDVSVPRLVQLAPRREGRFDYGTVPKLQPDANSSVASAFEALTTGNHPERISPVFTPEPFDRERYLCDPDSYLGVHEPGRVWQSAPPGPGVPVIQRVGRTKHVIRQGESVPLRVRTTASMPATFTSLDLGAFANGLSSITVAADDEGVAEAVFTGSSGTIGEVNIIAASPVVAERVRFTVYVARPSRSSSTPAVASIPVETSGAQ